MSTRLRSCQNLTEGAELPFQSYYMYIEAAAASSNRPPPPLKAKATSVVGASAALGSDSLGVETMPSEGEMSPEWE